MIYVLSTFYSTVFSAVQRICFVMQNRRRFFFYFFYFFNFDVYSL